MKNVIPPKTFDLYRLGDEKAYEEIFHKFISPVETFVKRLVRSNGVAEVLSQYVFIQLWMCRKRMESPDQIAPFLFRAAKNAALYAIVCIAMEDIKEERNEYST